MLHKSEFVLMVGMVVIIILLAVVYNKTTKETYVVDISGGFPNLGCGKGGCVPDSA